MKKWHVLVILSICLLFVTACSGGSSQSSGSSRSPFIGGTKGLEFGFEPDAPPPEVTDSNFPFKLILNIENLGEANVISDNLIIGIGGISAADFELTNNDILSDKARKINENVILGKLKDPDGDIIPGTLTHVTIPENEEFEARRISGNTPFTFQANACYPYHTRGNTKLCILRNIVNDGPDNICDATGGKTIHSSGSPIQFSNFRQAVVGKNEGGLDVIRFSFDVIHSGSGNVYSPELTVSSENGPCPRNDQSDRLNYEDVVRVYVNQGGLNSAQTIGGDILNTLNCGFEGGANFGYVRLINGRRSVSCTMELNSGRVNDFESLLEVYADFNYDQNIKKEVLVKHLDFGAS